MENHSLTERVGDLLKYWGLGNIGAFEAQGRIIFFLPFESFRAKGPESGKEYEFPGGHIILVYNPNSADLNYPFIKGRYTHPFLFGVDAENQPIPVNPYMIRGNRDDTSLPIEYRITQLFDNALMVLKAGSDKGFRNMKEMGLIPLYDLDSDIFRKYKVG